MLGAGHRLAMSNLQQAESTGVPGPAVGPGCPKLKGRDYNGLRLTLLLEITLHKCETILWMSQVWPRLCVLMSQYLLYKLGECCMNLGFIIFTSGYAGVSKGGMNKQWSVAGRHRRRRRRTRLKVQSCGQSPRINI